MKNYMEEYWDIYDVNRQLTGKTIKRGDVFTEGEYYVCCDIWIINSKQQMLMTQRHPAKKAGGLWEFSGGGVLAGETTKQAAVREIKEELDLIIDETELNLLEVFKNKNYFMDIFLVKKDFNLEEITLQPDEVVDAKFLSGEEIEKMITENKVVRSVATRYKMYKELLL